MIGAESSANPAPVFSGSPGHENQLRVRGEYDTIAGTNSGRVAVVIWRHGKVASIDLHYPGAMLYVELEPRELRILAAQLGAAADLIDQGANP